MLLPLPLSFFALLIFPFPSNGGQAAGEGKGFRRSRDFLSWPRMAYGACYLKGARFFDRGAMIAGAYPRSARWPIGIAACGLCLPIRI
ncbi:unnamed protein product [Thlaspi arvense]|uniref:Secreted protein n=1 Tax=Thlaspi arvense TaxID=13288 RepID=A0AAU9RIN9_THLAR|nr:unnamed protein product [Thlaspi arvense]